MNTETTALLPQLSDSLPLTRVALSDLALVTITGPDSQKYLQGQVTADIDALADDQHVLCAHCDAKGKMWSDLRLFHYKDGYAYLIRRSALDTQLAELKKYAVFSKITIAADDTAVLTGIAGHGAADALQPHFSAIPDADSQVVSSNDTTLLYLPLPQGRFILIHSAEQANALADALSLPSAAETQWTALDIEAGYAVIDTATVNEFLPQATNLQSLPRGICFKKGCYTGQEMVARAKFRGANKRAMFTLIGHSRHVPVTGDDAERQLGENWRRTGTILAAVRLSDERVLVQIVMNNDTEEEAVFRIREDEESRLSLFPLPYSFTEEA
ncbi:tRNA-modifying protein YgfZ [Morganella morganii]|uniref:tRNA-modifying protein YgfZ n=1 Tax=Morganella morganii TaxID=582 RepID=UPI003EBADAD2